MKLKSIKIKNFRSIEELEITNLENGISIVGQNNTGKTNILKAIEMFFTGNENKFNYNIKEHLTFGIQGELTNIVAVFIGDKNNNNDKLFYDEYEELSRHYEKTYSNNNDEIPIYLSFSSNGNPVYRFFTNNKFISVNENKSEIWNQQNLLIAQLINSFSCHYIPSSKSTKELMTILLTPYIRKSISSIIEKQIGEIRHELINISNCINSNLLSNKISDLNISVKIPNDSIEDIISSFDYNLIMNNQETSFYQHGMGIQIASFFASLQWITEEEAKQNKSVLWLIEEPESFLHPKLYKNCFDVLKELSKKADVVWTTHSLSFINQNIDKIISIKNENGKTKQIKYKKYIDATKDIREYLGVQFSDFFNLGKYNILVEGHTDRETFKYVLDELENKTHHNVYPLLSEADFLDFGGVSEIESFLKATYSFISQERVCIAIFDGDDAGKKKIKALNGYFQNKKINFASNQDYILMPSDVCLEGLFPSEWIKELYSKHKDWFDHWILDANANIVSFKIKDDKKSNVQYFFQEKIKTAESIEWSTGFQKIFEQLEELIENKSQKIYK